MTLKEAYNDTLKKWTSKLTQAESDTWKNERYDIFGDSCSYCSMFNPATCNHCPIDKHSKRCYDKMSSWHNVFTLMNNATKSSHNSASIMVANSTCKHQLIAAIKGMIITLKVTYAKETKGVQSNQGHEGTQA